MNAMATYYRVNLKDKQNNIVYPNVHNKWTFSADGSLKIDSGSITLQKGNIYLNGNASGTPESTTKLVFGNNTTQYVILRANSEKSLVISDSLTDNTYSIEYNRNNAAFSSTTSGKISLGTVSRKWSSIYVNWGNFYGDIERVVNEMDVTLSNNNISTQIWPTTFNIMDKNERIVNRIECIPCSNGNIESYWYLRNYGTDGTMVAQKGIRMTINKSGTLTYSVADPANFRSAISAVNKAGDTLTGNLSYNMNSSTQIPLKVYGGDVNGLGISVGAGGATIVGSGESAKALESILPATTEQLYLASDNDIAFITNCQTIGNRVSVNLSASREFYPNVNNTGTLGTSSYKWNNVYATTFTGNLSGTASKATADANGNTITSTYARLDGGNDYITVTTSGSNTTGYRLILEQTLYVWGNYRMTLMMASRHNGNGMLNIDISIHGALTSYIGHLVYYGGTIQYTNPFRAWYNPSDGKFRLYYYYSDYTPCQIKIITRLGFNALNNGSWSTSVPSGVGNELPRYNNGANLNVCHNNNAKYIRASSLSTWNSEYSGYSNGTVCFCW